MSSQPDKTLVPAYGSLKTLFSVLNKVREEGEDHLPDRVDRSLMPSLSGSGANETIATLKYLGLVAENGVPTKEFSQFVMASDAERKPMLGELIKKSYGFVFNSDFNVERATAAMAAELFRKQGVNGSTLTRAISFFLAACKEAGIKVSPNIKAPAPPKNGAGKLRREKSDSVDGGDTGAAGIGAVKQEQMPEGVHKFELPIPGKPSVQVLIPKELDGDDWAMFQQMFEIYVKRWKGFAAVAGNISEKEKGPSSM